MIPIHTKTKKLIESETNNKYEQYKKLIDEAIKLSINTDEKYTLSVDISDGEVKKIFFSKRIKDNLNTYGE